MWQRLLVKDFNRVPARRFYTDGAGSGEEFREKHLKPAIEALEGDQTLTVILDDDVEMLGSSFLVEGFAGLVRYGYCTREEFQEKIVLKWSDPDFEFFARRIKEYVQRADFDSAEYIPSNSKS